MMIEPPRQRRMRRVLEIDNGVLITVEHGLVTLVQHSALEPVGRGRQADQLHVRIGLG